MASAAAPARACSCRRSIFDKVVAGIAAAPRRSRSAPGMDAETEMGPLVSQSQHGRVTGYLQCGAEEGARAADRRQHDGNRGYFVQPTVLVDTSRT